MSWSWALEPGGESAGGTGMGWETGSMPILILLALSASFSQARASSCSARTGGDLYWCPVSCVLCPVSCVLCHVSCVLCHVSCFLCLVFCVLCLVSCVLCLVSCVLFPVCLLFLAM